MTLPRSLTTAGIHGFGAGAVLLAHCPRVAFSLIPGREGGYLDLLKVVLWRRPVHFEGRPAPVGNGAAFFVTDIPSLTFGMGWVKDSLSLGS